MKKEIVITPNQIKQSINDLLDEVEYWQKQSTEANNKIDKAIEYLKLFDDNSTLIDHSIIKGALNILQGEDEDE